MKRAVVWSIAIFIGLLGSGSLADAPNVRTPAPVIYLADNLDEAASLGWCIDTVGRGFSGQLHAHSCKPQGGDVQFALVGEQGVIRSVAFPDYCMQVQSDQTVPLGMATCETENPAQQFKFTPETQAISPVSDMTSCIAVGTESRSAGPFMSRDLMLLPCEDVEPIYRSWVVVNE
ncbi:RICIN domain-containing protein [Aliiroseovarius sp. 2305UL8-7]|uniref:RICIN domain-containing protein n=1 Tax=Aliiroseovarius conchicola TaxID=3121637 RepID=UPI00352803C9